MFISKHPYLFFLLVLSGVIGISIVLMTWIVTMTLSGRGGWSPAEAQVGVVEVSGFLGEASPTLKQLKDFRENDAIKAIVVRINSPGGTVGPAQEIFKEIRKTTRQKKVVASMGTVAASGGYYIAAGADKIMANAGTITGSIGVIMQFSNFQELLEKIGLRPVVVKSGNYKDMGSPTRPMTAEERKLLEGLAAKIHRQFVSDVAEGRQMAVETVQPLADGRILTGEDALENGLVDKLGNLEDAIEWAGRLSGVEGKVRAYYAPDPDIGWLERFLGVSFRDWLFQMRQETPVALAIATMPGR